MQNTGMTQNYQKNAGELKIAKWSTFLPKVTWNIVIEGPSQNLSKKGATCFWMKSWKLIHIKNTNS